jgi:pyruvate carboxylase
VRLDGGTVFVGAEIGAYFDSMLVKVTCRGADFETAVRRSRRVLAEFRIRGVSTNIPFLQALLAEPDFVAGRLSTSFIEEHPGLLTSRRPADRGTKLLTYLAEVTVNKPYGGRRATASPQLKLPSVDFETPPSPGAREWLLRVGPEQWARDLRTQTAVGVTDTTFRDAHQSLLATRVRTRDLMHRPSRSLWPHRSLPVTQGPSGCPAR